MDTTLVLGASTKPWRVSHTAIQRLEMHRKPVIAIGRETGVVGGTEIVQDFNGIKAGEIHTVTMYLSARNQQAYIQPILDLRPKRVIFNPGSENPEFCRKLTDAGIECENACTLVMLSTGQY